MFKNVDDDNSFPLIMSKIGLLAKRIELLRDSQEKSIARITELESKIKASEEINNHE